MPSPILKGMGSVNWVQHRRRSSVSKKDRALQGSIFKKRPLRQLLMAGQAYNRRDCQELRCLMQKSLETPCLLLLL